MSEETCAEVLFILLVVFAAVGMCIVFIITGSTGPKGLPPRPPKKKARPFLSPSKVKGGIR